MDGRHSILHTAKSARMAESMGCDAFWVGETSCDPFLKALQDDEATRMA
jgi:alkanesulfonate monooxygenase SsuD/methylene tetrahydromethanopterin reductase-like flavin-dependent oxidoreductase (luciferase family)